MLQTISSILTQLASQSTIGTAQRVRMNTEERKMSIIHFQSLFHLQKLD